MHNYERAAKALDTKSQIPYRAAIVGARGYSGLELARLLLKHPLVELKGCFATDGEFQLSQYLHDTGVERVVTWKLSELAEQAQKLDVIFLATPAEASLDLAPQVLKSGVHVIDLSGAFRLTKGSAQERLTKYKSWYGIDHHQDLLLSQAENGLQPWARPSVSNTKRLIANPGCYATAAMMALIPLLKNKVLQPKGLVLDAKSGTSGAGRKASEAMLFTEVEGECLPYKVGKHQHLPEIIEGIEQFAQTSIAPFFNTHLLNVRRGIIVSIYAQPAEELAGVSDVDLEKCIESAYAEAYSRYPLVRFAAWNKGGDQLVSLKKVVGSARTHLAFRVSGGKIYLFSLIDNLLKGAAGQAVENLNRLMDQPCEFGLAEIEGVL